MLEKICTFWVKRAMRQLPQITKRKRDKIKIEHFGVTFSPRKTKNITFPVGYLKLLVSYNKLQKIPYSFFTCHNLRKLSTYINPFGTQIEIRNMWWCADCINHYCTQGKHEIDVFLFLCQIRHQAGNGII